MDLEWIPPLKDGGSKILGYWVEYKEEETEAWLKVIEVKGVQGSLCSGMKLGNFLILCFLFFIFLGQRH